MKDKNSDKLLKFNKFSFLPILDGLDTFLNLSIITYLSIFFLQNLDNRISILIMTFVVLLSFFSRNNILCLLEKVFLKKKYNKINLYFIFSIIYFIPIFIIQDLNLFSLFIFVLCRFFVGNLFYIAKKDYLLSDSFKKENYFFLKYLIIFISGMLIGTLVYVFFNDIFSNSQMNSWGWKCSYIFLFIISLILGFFIKYNVAFVNFDRYKELKLNSSVNRNLSFNFKNICSIIPFYIFFIFSCENWLPKFVNPENMQFLDYGIINIFLVVILTLFTFPLFNLIGNRKLNNFVSVLIILISMLAFLFEYSSSYSIDFLKFYLSIISSFLISLNYLNFKQSNETNVIIYLSVLSLTFIILSIITPLSFYFFINFSISYNIIYLIIGMLFLISFLAGKYGER